MVFMFKVIHYCQLIYLKTFEIHVLKYVDTHRKLKESLNYGYVLKKVDKIIKFNQKDWFKHSIDMNTELQKKANNYFGKDISSS